MLIDNAGKLRVCKKLKAILVKLKSVMHYSKEDDKIFLILFWKIFIFNFITM